MNFISIFNDVLGPVMRGPSSSHTAGSFFIGKLVRSLMDEKPVSASFTFDPRGSYAQVFRQQGVDLAFAAGIMGWEITDDRFSRALENAESQGIELKFKIIPIKNAVHPNTVVIEIISSTKQKMKVKALSVGGGAIQIIELDEWPVEITGKAYEIVVVTDKKNLSLIKGIMTSDGKNLGKPFQKTLNDKEVVTFRSYAPLDNKVKDRIIKHKGTKRIWNTSPLFYVKKGKQIFTSTEEMITQSKKKNTLWVS